MLGDWNTFYWALYSLLDPQAGYEDGHIDCAAFVRLISSQLRQMRLRITPGFYEFEVPYEHVGHVVPIGAQKSLAR